MKQLATARESPEPEVARLQLQALVRHLHRVLRRPSLLHVMLGVLLICLLNREHLRR